MVKRRAVGSGVVCCIGWVTLCFGALVAWPWAEAQAETTDDGWTDLYVVNSDGSNLTRLTHDVDMEQDPAWSPHGNTIAYVVHKLLVFSAIHLIEADGSNHRTLTDNDSFSFSPSWSPDGSRMAFSSSRLDGMLRIFVMDADGGNVKCLTEGFEKDSYHEAPRWAPNSNDIAFYLTDAELMRDKARVCLVNADNGNPHICAETKGEPRFLEWIRSTDDLLLVTRKGTEEPAVCWLVSSKSNKITGYEDSMRRFAIRSARLSLDGTKSTYLRRLSESEFYKTQPGEAGPKAEADETEKAKRGTVLHSQRGVGFGNQIVVADGQGSNPRMITRERFSKGSIGFMCPSISPDGSRIVALRTGSDWNPVTVASVLCKETRSKRARESKGTEKRIGWLMLGANGELIMPPEGISPGPGSLLVYKCGEKLELRLSDKPVSPPYGYVSAGGYLSVQAAEKPGGLDAATPKQWPFAGGKKDLVLPPANTVLSSFPALGKKKKGAPSGTVGWAMLLADGSLYRPKTKEVPANALWIRKTKDGLDFIHAGPLHSGVYAHVGKDRHVVLSGAVAQDDESVFLWPFMDEKKRLVPPPEGFYEPKDSSEGVVYIVYSSGAVGAFDPKFLAE